MTNFISLNNNVSSNPHRSAEHPFQAPHVFEGRKSHPGNGIAFGLHTKNKCCKAKNVFPPAANLLVGAWLEGPEPLLLLSRVLSVFFVRLL